MFHNHDDRKRPFLVGPPNESNAKRKSLPRRVLNDDYPVKTNDEIHVTIDLCPVMKALIDTAPMQRLKHIKQLGTSDFVYMNANHTRFEHSLGVAHLAKTMVEEIKARQRKLQVTSKDVLCVKLAGLLHDIGHGPFSHIFEQFRSQHEKCIQESLHLQEVYKQFPAVPKGWAHEDSSLLMIDAVLAELGLKIDPQQLDKPLREIPVPDGTSAGVDALSMRVFDENGECLTSRDFLFIKECISGDAQGPNGQFIGRESKKQEWLYDVVNNRHSGLDVDKVDYFARDARRAFGGAGKIDKITIMNARVAKVYCPNSSRSKDESSASDGWRYMICYPMKHDRAIMNFFSERFRLHSIVYQHKAIAAVAHMISDIFSAADPYLLLPSVDKSNNKRLPMSRAVMDSNYLVGLKDNVIDLIEFTGDPNLAKAKALVARLNKRQLYKQAVRKHIETDLDEKLWKMDDKDIRGALLYTDRREGDGKSISLVEDDIIVGRSSIHHGQKDTNPLLRVHFFEKRLTRMLENEEMENLPFAIISPEAVKGPKVLWERSVQILVRDATKKDRVEHVFQQWYSDLKDGGGFPATTTLPFLCEDDYETSNQFDTQDYGEGNFQTAGSNMLTQESEGDDDEAYQEQEPTSLQFEKSPSPILRQRH